MIREILPGDVAAVVGLVHELAAYEREAPACALTPGQLDAALFAPAPALFGHVAEVDGEVVGCALWFLSFSTWRGAHGICRNWRRLVWPVRPGLSPASARRRNRV